MTSQGWLQIGLTLLIGFLISIPVGRYLARVVTGRKTSFDRLFDPIDNFIYLLIGRRICGQAMDWKAYTLHMLATNLVMALIIFLVLVFQDRLPLNPRHFAGMEPMLAFNTAVSFITNTDWQAYGGETTLSNFSQMAAITFPMFTSATTGFVVAMAFIRAFTVKDGGADLGNFYRDLVRFTTRVLMPASFVLALLMIQQGEPQTLAANVIAHTVQGADQTIALGPVASLETIKHMGTNGGGFFNANASHPYRESDRYHQPGADAADDHVAELDRDLLRRDDRQPPTRLGPLRRHGRAAAHVPAGRRRAGTGRHAALGEGGHRDCRQPDPARRQHGGQGGALRRRPERIVRQHHHDLHDRQRELHA